MTEIRKRIFACLIAAVLALLLFAKAAYADDETDEAVLKVQDIDTERELSLTVEFEAGEGSVSGAQISIYKAASVYTEGGACFYTALAGDYSYEGMTAQESNETALELSQLLEDEEPYASGVTGSDGLIVFEGLEAGIYLVILDEPVSDADGNEYIFEPYLACVPLAMEEDGMYVWTYEVVSTPKSAAVSETEEPGEPETETGEPEEETDEPGEPETETEEPDEPETTDTGSPSVGDDSDLWLWCGAAAIAGAAVFCLKKRKRKDD